jgi:hypothetical protein
MYCNQITDSATKLNVIKMGKCPAGFYCPLGTLAPIPCKPDKGEICNQGASFPSRTVISSSICKSGEYFGYGQCNPCEPGHVCVRYTSTKYPVFLDKEGGYECPPGSYCPRGSQKEIPCPAGTYNPLKKGKTLDDCLACPNDAFSDQPGQVSCVKCGRGSRGSLETNFENCVCIGLYRQWRKSDNQCICQSGFVEPKTPTIEGVTTVQN